MSSDACGACPALPCAAFPLLRMCVQNGLTLSGHLNRMGLLTLPDLYRRKYGKLMEVIVSFIEVASFTCLLAGNLVGTSLLLQFIFGVQQWAGVLVSGILMAVFTIAGGLFSIAYVDVPQVTDTISLLAAGAAPSQSDAVTGGASLS